MVSKTNSGLSSQIGILEQNSAPPCSTGRHPFTINRSAILVTQKGNQSNIIESCEHCYQE